jgi:hypothetical protein
MNVNMASAAFPVDVKAVTIGIRKAFADVLTSAGADPMDRRSISERTGLSETLSWKLSKIVTTDDTTVVLRQMPRRAGIKTFLQRAGRAGAEPTTLAAAKKAVNAYEQLIETHSGDRDTLMMLGGAISQSNRQQQDEHHRKLAFQGTSYIWGAQARAMLKVRIIGPGSRPGLIDVAHLNVLAGFRRLRPGVSWVVGRRWWVKNDGSKLPDHQQIEEVLDRRHRADGSPLIEDFCSRPLPEVRLTPQDDSSDFKLTATQKDERTFELVEGPVGNVGSVTCVIGTLTRNLPGYATPGNEQAMSLFSADTPAECFIVDTLVHESFLGNRPMRASLHGQLRFGNGRLDSGTKLPLAEPLQEIGKATLTPPTPEFKDYDAMIAWAFEQRNWNRGSFRMYRMRMTYPVLSSAIVLSFNLPESAPL